MAENKARGWAFTMYDFEEKLKVLIEKDIDAKPAVSYIVAGRENCPETGKEHLQGYVHFTNAVTMKSAKKWLGDNTVHVERARLNASKNREYCVKEGKIEIEKGDIPTQGSRTDLSAIKKRIVDEGASVREVLDENLVTSYQELRFAESVAKYGSQKLREKPIVKWFCGPPGCGKTSAAIEEAIQICGDDWWKSSGNLKWWDGYFGQSGVIIDDLRRDFCKFHELLGILDRYPYRVEYKGGSQMLKADHIWITCPKSPEELWEGRVDEDLKQLMRRIDSVERWTEIRENQDKDDETKFRRR